MINNLKDEYAHHEDLVGRLLGAIGQGHKLAAAERERLVEKALTTGVDALVPLITAVNFLADGPNNVAFDAYLHGPLLRSNEGLTHENRSWFHVACARGDLDAATAFVERCGLDPKRSEPDYNGETPLHTAAVRGHLDVVAFLLFKCDLDQTQKDGLGRTPRDCAEDHPMIEDLFEALPPPSSRVAKEVARQMAQEMEQAEGHRLPTGTLIKDWHEELDDNTRWIQEYLGRGTFGHVYETYHPHAQRKEAVKVVRFVGRRGKPLEHAERIERLRSQLEEAEIMLKLGLHPSLVAVRGIFLLRAMQSSSGEPVADNLYIFMEIGRASCREKV